LAHQEQLLALGDDLIDLLDRSFHPPPLGVAADPMAELLGDLIVGDAKWGDHVCLYVRGPCPVALRARVGDCSPRITSPFLSGR